MKTRINFRRPKQGNEMFFRYWCKWQAFFQSLLLIHIANLYIHLSNSQFAGDLNFIDFAPKWSCKRHFFSFLYYAKLADIFRFKNTDTAILYFLSYARRLRWWNEGRKKSAKAQNKQQDRERKCWVDYASFLCGKKRFFAGETGNQPSLTSHGAKRAFFPNLWAAPSNIGKVCKLKSQA